MLSYKIIALPLLVATTLADGRAAITAAGFAVDYLEARHAEALTPIGSMQDGPVRLLVVECDHTLALRATAQWDAARVAALPDDAPLAALAGGPERSRLVITLQPHEGPLYQGIVELASGSVAQPPRKATAARASKRPKT